MRRVLVYLGILEDPNGPPKGSARYWLRIALPTLVLVVLVLIALQLWG